MKKETNLLISGWGGIKDKETGKWVADKETLRAGLRIFKDKGINELKIQEIHKVFVGDNNAADLIGLQFSKDVNVQPVSMKADWNSFATPTLAAKDRSARLVENASHAVIFTYSKSYGGNGLLESVAEKGIPTLVINIDEDTYFVAKGQDLIDQLKVVKKKSTLDHKTICQHLLRNNFLTFDVETTGIGIEARVIQLAFTEVATGICLFETLLKTDEPSCEAALAVHGITEKSREKAPAFKEIFPVVNALISKFSCTAYNSGFDYFQINQEYARIGEEMPVLRFEDVMPIATAFFGEKLKQELICDRLGIKRGEHSAKGDTIALAEIIRKLAELDKPPTA